MRTRSSNIDILRAGLIGSMSAWLPSRRSVDSHRGASVMTADGQVRSGRSIGGNGRYRSYGMPLGFWLCRMSWEVMGSSLLSGGAGARSHSAARGSGSCSDLAAAAKEKLTHRHDDLTL